MRPPPIVVAFGLLLLVAIAASPPRRVGDAREYLAMAMNMASFRSPALLPADAVRLERQLDASGFTGLTLTFPELRDEQGRQDFFHFWFYSALAVPFMWLAAVLRSHPNHAFSVLNAILFLGALWVVSLRLRWWFAALVFCSPVLWWIDKSHTEVFTFSLLAAAFALVEDRPWWSMVCVGAAATQNLPIAALLPGVLLVALLGADRGRDRRVWRGAAFGLGLALLHPVYYGWRWGVPTPQLLQGTDPHVPTLQELGTVLWDPNIGLLFHAPAFVAALAVAVLCVGIRARHRLAEREVGLAAAGATLFLLSFAQTTNANHGGTPGMSRYALWLVPLCVPVLRRAGAVHSSCLGRWLISLALVSCAWSAVVFRPWLPENYRAPTRVASFIWKGWPWLDNPLPEIFAERVSGKEPGRVPVATADCAKVLLIGGQWPVPCAPSQSVPFVCESPSRLCYANRVREGYDFVQVGSRRYAFHTERTWTWGRGSRGFERVLQLARWRDLRPVDVAAPGGFVRAAHNVSWSSVLQSEDQLLARFNGVGRGASVTLRLPGVMSGWLLDAETGEQTGSLRLGGSPWEPVRVDLPESRAAALALVRSR